MSWKRFSVLDRETIILIVTILIVICIEVYLIVTVHTPTEYVYLVPIVSILLVFLIFLFVVSKAEARLNRSLDQRLPPIEYLETRKEVEIETTKLAEQANDFILATGERSRNSEYMAVIENKIGATNLPYWRLVYGGPITHELCQHICKVLHLPNVVVTQVVKEDYGDMLVIDAGFMIALPLPGHGGLMGIKSQNRSTAQRLFLYFMMVMLDSSATRITSEQEVKALCEVCARSGSNSVGQVAAN